MGIRLRRHLRELQLVANQLMLPRTGKLLAYYRRLGASNSEARHLARQARSGRTLHSWESGDYWGDWWLTMPKGAFKTLLDQAEKGT